MKSISLSFIVPLMALAMLFLGTGFGRSFIVSTPADYQFLVNQGWALSTPIWKPDSSLVLVDKPGNIPFTALENNVLDSLGVQRIPGPLVRDWLLTNEWIEEDEE